MSSPIAAVGVVTVDRGRVLLIKRRYQPYAGLWAIPGGKIHFGETLCQAAEREMREETGLQIQALEPIHTVELMGAHLDGTSYHYIVIEMAARILCGELRAADDACEAKWFGLHELRQFEIESNSRALIERILANEFDCFAAKPA